MNKQMLRDWAKNEIAGLDSQQKTSFDTAIAERVFLLLKRLGMTGEPGMLVSAYHPMPIEVNCIPLIETLYARRFRMCFPALLNPDHPKMIFRELSLRDYQIDPKTDFFISGVGDVVLPDILLIPIVAYHRHGYRLGYGGGYYDQALHHFRNQKNVIAIGMGYGISETNVPFYESHDEKMDYIVTEKELIDLT